MSSIDPTHAAPEVNAEAPTVVRQNKLPPPSPEVIPASTSSLSDVTGTGDKTVISRRPSMDAPVVGTPAETAVVLVGRRLDHFVLEELIGGGGMGAVFRARDTRLDRIVAVKVLPRVSQDPDLLRRFRVEAQSAARLDHPNIARIYDVGQQDGWHYIVFEHIEGVNIRDLVDRQGVLSVDQAVYFVYQTAEALQHAWKRGVVHRDVKPSNLLVDSAGHVRLVDMGLARSQAVELSDDLTASNVTLGTFDYISPEQARDPRIADVRSDLYSLGCTLYYMLAGQPPYPGGTVVQKLLSHGSSPPPDLRLVRPDVSDDLAAILFKLLSKQPDYRYQEPVDLMGDLAELARRERLPFSHSTDLTLAPVSTGRWGTLWHYHLPWIAAVGMLLTSIIGLKLATPVTVEPPEPPQSSALLGSNAQSNNPIPLKAASEIPLPAVAGLSPTAALPPGTSIPAPSIPISPALSISPSESPISPPSGAMANAGPRDSSGILPPAKLPSSNLPSANVQGSALASVPSATTPKVIRVAPQGAVATIGQEVSTSIEDAFKRAAQLPHVEAIEIDADRVVMGRVRVPRDGLVMRPAVGRRPLIICEDPDKLRMQRPAMLRTHGFSLRLEDLHFHWTVRPSVHDGGTIFSLIGGEELSFARCSITIENTGQREAVNAIEILPDTAAGIDLAGASSKLTTISLQDSLVRGQLSVISMDYAVPARIRINNAVLATSGRLLESGGTDRKDSVSPVTIQLELTRVTAYTNGLVMVRTGPSGQFPPFIQRKCDQCVIFGGTSALAIMEFNNLTTIPHAVVPWSISGEGTAYAGSSEPLVRATTLMGEHQQWRLSDVANESWYQERRPKFGISVLGVWPLDEPYHSVEAADLDVGDVAVGFRQELPPPASGLPPPL